MGRQSQRPAFFKAGRSNATTVSQKKLPAVPSSLLQKLPKKRLAMGDDVLTLVVAVNAVSFAD